ncbi:hypothetical protein I350_07363 [Cryptococcus amylolentus CBS 6273]|uniref:Phosphoribulokinase/uridine kinase domain-containing protein n=1 Tax=Cryptococcus amylolentus CBS 6273 TaxID=1296118 RepID=A0A1E3JED1_9TREE|nr:hypothetical protein I350_07363 [Cryptococcus amylolentus CBS 6273]
MVTQKVVLIGIGGASCSGKTLLAKHISQALPQNAIIIHQDDFCPPADQVPYSKEYPDLQDWDDPSSCILWQELQGFLAKVRQTGRVEDHSSHDHLNKQNKIPIDQVVFERWAEAFRSLDAEQRQKGVELIWVIVDGFVLYWDKIDGSSARLMFSNASPILRYDDRHRLNLATDPDDAAEGGVWTDPPDYFDKIVWPGYLKAHSHVLDGPGLTQLKPEWGPKGLDLHVICPGEGADGLSEAFDKSCQAVLKGVESGKGSIIA